MQHPGKGQPPSRTKIVGTSDPYVLTSPTSGGRSKDLAGRRENPVYRKIRVEFERCPFVRHPRPLIRAYSGVRRSTRRRRTCVFSLFPVTVTWQVELGNAFSTGCVCLFLTISTPMRIWRNAQQKLIKIKTIINLNLISNVYEVLQYKKNFLYSKEKLEYLYKMAREAECVQIPKRPYKGNP